MASVNAFTSSFHRASCVAISTLVTLAAAPAFADDGSIESIQGSIRLMRENPHVRMVSEDVRAVVSGGLYASVRCTFVLRNEGPADSVWIGFPDADSSDYHMASLENFRSWVDGAPVRCERTPGGSYDVRWVPYWWTKRVWFPAGATRTIRDEYQVRASSSHSTGDAIFEYLLWTGASWKGAIGRATIRVRLEDVPRNRIREVTPGVRREGREYRWNFLELEPGRSERHPESIVLRWHQWDADADDDRAP